MLHQLRPYLTRRRAFGAAAALCAVLLLLPWMPAYAPLREGMTRHYQEAASRGPRAAQRAAEEEARRQQEAARQQAQEEQRRTVREHGMKVAEFRRIVQAHRPPVEAMLENVGGALRAVMQVAHSPSFYEGGSITPEETSTRRACGDPASTADYLSRTARRDRNIFACAVYLAINRQEAEQRPGGRAERNVTMALLQRVAHPADAARYPFQTIVAYVWIDQLSRIVNQGQPPGAFPDLTTGDDLNPALLGGLMSQGFARRLIETASVSEKLSLRTNVYPDMRRLAELGGQIVPMCQLLQRSQCLRD